MRGIIQRAWLVVYLALAISIAACDTTQEERVATACSALCTCQAPPLPGLQNQCVAMCTSQAGGFDISDACVACISDHSNQCSTLETECQNACDPQANNADAAVFPPPIVVDAPEVFDSF